MGAKLTQGPASTPMVRTFVASGAIVKGSAVVYQADGAVQAPAATATGCLDVLGIALEAAASGEDVAVVILGEARAIASAAITPGQRLKADNTAGKVTPTSTDNDGIFATALSAAAADTDEVLILVTGMGRY